MDQRLVALREQIDTIDRQLLKLLSHRAEVAEEVQKIKSEAGLPILMPGRERALLAKLEDANQGPLSDEHVREVFGAILKVSVDHMRQSAISHRDGSDSRSVAGLRLGALPLVIAGPCAVESREQIFAVARALSEHGVSFLRGGAFKPRSSPYSFQGLGREGLELLSEAARYYGLRSVTEVMDPQAVELVARYADVLQIGARNMFNEALLREAGRSGKTVLIKRGLMATMDEWLAAAEVVTAQGTQEVILCERGIRTFERETRNTLDLAGLVATKARTHHLVIADVSHAAGRKDILHTLSRAALAAGADGLMLEVHPWPDLARSDQHQQLDLEAFEQLISGLGARLSLGKTGS